MEDKKELAIEQYDFTVKNRYRTRGAFLLETNKGPKLLREQAEYHRHFALENQIKQHLFEYGMTRLDQVYPNKEGKEVTEFPEGQRYVVYNWFYGEECDAFRQGSLMLAGENLGRLHKGLSSFSAEDEQEGESLRDILAKRTRELKRIYGYMRNKKRKNEFEILAMRCFSEFYKESLVAMERMDQWEKEYGEPVGRVMCHGDYNYHNLIYTSQGVATTAFEKARVGHFMEDLYYFLRKTMEKNNWDNNKGNSFLEGYQKERVICDEEKELLYILLLFPDKYWKLMNHYQNRKKAWVSRRNLEKLISIREQQDAKRKYLQLFF